MGNCFATAISLHSGCQRLRQDSSTVVSGVLIGLDAGDGGSTGRQDTRDDRGYTDARLDTLVAGGGIQGTPAASTGSQDGSHDGPVVVGRSGRLTRLDQDGIGRDRWGGVGQRWTRRRLVDADAPREQDETSRYDERLHLLSGRLRMGKAGDPFPSTGQVSSMVGSAALLGAPPD